MNWDMLSAIGEILGSVAVLVTLIFLTKQMRQNSASSQASARQAILEDDQQFLFRALDDPDLVLLRYKPELTLEEKIRINIYMTAFFRMRENLWRQYRSGVLDYATWESYRSSIVGFSSKRVKNWWRSDEIQATFDPEFAALVSDILEETPDSEQPSWLSAFD